MALEIEIKERKIFCANRRCRAGINRTRAIVYISSIEKRGRKYCSACRMESARKRHIKYIKKRDERKPPIKLDNFIGNE